MSESNYTPHVGQPYAVTPETDAVWDDKIRNILTHSQNLERQRDEAREERDTALAQLDVLEQSIADLSHRNMRMLVADIEAERAARKALTEALQGMMKAEMEVRQSNGWGADEVEAEPHWMAARAALTLASKLP